MLSLGGNGSNNTATAEKQPPFQPAPVPTASQSSPGLRVPSNRKTIYDRHLNRSRNGESSRAGFAFLFGEMVTYAQRRVTGIQDLERRLVCTHLTTKRQPSMNDGRHINKHWDGID